MNNNISSLKTKKALSEALIFFMKSKPIEKISISDITEKCSLNRQTFYYHFHDIYELTEWLFKEKTKEVLGEDILISNWEEAIIKVASFIKENKQMLEGMLNSVGNKSITNFIHDYIRPYIKNYILSVAKTHCNIKVVENQLPKDSLLDEYYLDFISNFYTITLSGILVYWVSNNKNLDETELVRLIKITVGTNTKDAIFRYIDSKKSAI